VREKEVRKSYVLPATPKGSARTRSDQKSCYLSTLYIILCLTPYLITLITY
jgi:hypothetical protein